MKTTNESLGMKQIEKEARLLLIKLGASPNYIGFEYCCKAVCLAWQKPDRLGAVTKEIYMVIAREYQTTYMAVERDIRTVIGRIWKHDPAAFAQTVGYSRSARPCASQFIALMYAYLSMKMSEE